MSPPSTSRRHCTTCGDPCYASWGTMCAECAGVAVPAEHQQALATWTPYEPPPPPREPRTPAETQTVIEQELAKWRAITEAPVRRAAWVAEHQRSADDERER